MEEMFQKNTVVVLPCVYLGPVQYYSVLKNSGKSIIELYEHFPKQTYRNRCEIYGANGKLRLSIPLANRTERTIINDIKINNNDNWQKLHWRSIESAYRRSPFFEYYEADFISFYENKFDFLVDFNLKIQEKILSLLKFSPTIEFTTEYVKSYSDCSDYRNTISPKKDITKDNAFEIKPYNQAFESKFGFIPNLSIIDLLFNQGPKSLDYM